MKINKKLFDKFPASGPRYTSYPTAPEWKQSINDHKLVRGLELASQSDSPLSVYIHIPFCQSLCHYCGCTVSIRKHDLKYGDEYLIAIEKEIQMIVNHLGNSKKIQQFHLGGGTPTFLSTEQLTKLLSICHKNFDFQKDAEVAIEVDPRTVEEDQLLHLRKLGFNRISFGVQDVDEKVQKAINRIQDRDQISNLVQKCRDYGFDSINLDFIYGLPLQTVESMNRMVDFILEVNPDRIALYSFAHIPWIKQNQKKINSEDLPSFSEKLNMFLNASERLVTNGYLSIAMDHFAKKDDAMAVAYEEGKLNRNFMGYTLLPADNFLGIGASAISYLHGSYIQNEKRLPEYYDAINKSLFPLKNDYNLSSDDLLRKEIIDSVMCHFKIDTEYLSKKYNIKFNEYFSEELSHLKKCIDEKIMSYESAVYKVTESGKLFVRNIAMGFDKYLLKKKLAPKRYSSVV